MVKEFLCRPLVSLGRHSRPVSAGGIHRNKCAIVIFMALARRILVIIVGSLSFIAGVNLGVPAIGRLARYYIYAQPHMMEDIPLGSPVPTSPVFGLVLNSFLGLILAAAGIALIMRRR